MLTTPVIFPEAYASYFHNPIENEAFIKALSPKEKQIYVLGYIQAAHQMQENLGDSKRLLLNKLMSDDIEPSSESKFKACLRLLDSLDDSLDSRVHKLEQHFFG